MSWINGQSAGQHELGLAVHDVTPALLDFRYRATDASGMVEHEIWPVFTATVHSQPRPNSEEVAEFAWTRLAALTVLFIFSSSRLDRGIRPSQKGHALCLIRPVIAR